MFLIKEGDGGSLVQMVQLSLKRAGFDPLFLDGIFGGRTKSAVIDFQKSRGLIPDGIVGKNTFLALRPFIVGYTVYTVSGGDTVYSIANKLGSTVSLIENANKNLSAFNLQVGRNILVPFNFSLVPTNIAWSSLLTELVCEGLEVRYPFAVTEIIGRSVKGAPIVMLKIGDGENKVFFNASHHANEWITTPMVLKFTEEYLKSVTNAGSIGGANAEETFNSTTLYIVPMVNPDGVDLVTGAMERDGEDYYDIIRLANNYPGIPFPSGWKANINGVDLNLNYPAMWEQAREQKFLAGFTLPGPLNFVGEAPLDQPETKAIYDISREIGFDLTLSLHTQGEEIYWRFGEFQPNGGRELGEKMAAVSGYTLTDPIEFQSYAGYKDWFIMTYLKPGYTIEAGIGQNPLPIEKFDVFYPPVRNILAVALSHFNII
ncbi:MAG: peptidoglycan-binding protein [Clostridia bacterium]|nr:peptidoglycan-binding protein [Clostridia bacterium]